MPFQLPSLLDNQDSLAPSMGLLSAFQQPPSSPMQALQQMATQPTPNAGMPGSGPVAPTPPKPAGAVPLARTPEPMNPLKAGIVSGGLQLLQDSSTTAGPAPSVGTLIARALAAGVPAFVASKQAKETRGIEMDRQKQYHSMLKDLVASGTLKPEQARLAEGFDADTGMKYIEDLQKERDKITVVGKKAIRGSGDVVAQDQDHFKEVNGQIVALDANGDVANGADGKPKILADLRTKPDIHMSEEQAGIARSINLDPNDVANWKEPETKRFNAELFRIKNAGAAKTNISLGEAAGEKAAMEGAVGGVVDQQKELRKSAQSFNTASEALRLLNSGDIFSGTGAEFRTKFANVLASAGIGDQATSDKVARTQQFMGATQELTTQLVHRLGSGNGITDTDVKFINGITGRDISMRPGAIKYLLVLQQRAQRAEALRHNEEVQTMQGISDQAKHNLMVPVPDETPAMRMAREQGEANDRKNGGGGTAPAAAATAAPTSMKGTGRIGGKSVPLENINGQWYFISGNKASPYTGPVDH